MALTASEAYQNELFQAHPSRMVVMLYDEILEALRISVNCIERSDIVGRCNAVNVATELLSTLYLCLDMEKGGEIANNLGNIYGFVLKNLPKVNVYNDPEPAKDAIRLLEPLRASWSELDGMADAGTLAAATLEATKTSGVEHEVDAA